MKKSSCPRETPGPGPSTGTPACSLFSPTDRWIKDNPEPVAAPMRKPGDPFLVWGEIEERICNRSDVHQKVKGKFLFGSTHVTIDSYWTGWAMDGFRVDVYGIPEWARSEHLPKRRFKSIDEAKAALEHLASEYAKEMMQDQKSSLSYWLWACGTESDTVNAIPPQVRIGKEADNA